MTAPAQSRLAAEIAAQPAALARFREREGERVCALGEELAGERPAGVLIAARGSSDHAAVYAQYVFGTRLRLPVALAAPSLFTVYKSFPDLRGWTVLGISQSGASPDVVTVVAQARAQGCTTLAITDRTGSELAAAAERVIPLHLGGERSVAATGSFTTSLFALAHLAVGWAGSGDDALLADVPARLAAALEAGPAAAEVAGELAAAGVDVAFVLGRGFGYPLALEWSLKLKEVAGLFAEAYSAADYRHGPIALASPSTPALVIDLPGPAREDTRALARQLAERGVRVVRASEEEDAALPLPPGPEWLAPIPAAAVGQLLATELARARGLDPDHPRGLEKVTRTL